MKYSIKCNLDKSKCRILDEQENEVAKYEGEDAFKKATDKVKSLEK